MSHAILFPHCSLIDQEGNAISSLIHTHFDKCTGCSICQLACSFALFGGYNPRLARLAIRHKKEHLYHIPVVCNQCENAYCMAVCPRQAIARNDQGVVIIDQDRCIGCKLCIRYCPVDMIQYNPDSKKSYKCELCEGNPACIAACPTAALTLVRPVPDSPNNPDNPDNPAKRHD